MCRGEVRAHAVGGRRSGPRPGRRRRQRRAGGLDRRDQGRPFGLPAAEAALVLLHMPARIARPGRARARRPPAPTAQPTGLRLCGIVDEPAAAARTPRPPRPASAARRRARSCRACRCRRRTRRHRREPVAVRVPGRVGHGQPELVGQRLLPPPARGRPAPPACPPRRRTAARARRRTRRAGARRFASRRRASPRLSGRT